MNDIPAIALSDGNSIPQIGLGVWRTPDNIAAPTVRTALSAGYRHIDTAAIYENERGVGEGIRTSGVDRRDVYLTTKLWNDQQGFDSTLKAFDESLRRLGTDYVDLYLIHWPAPDRHLYVDTWRAFVRLKSEGRARSIGVSNFCPEHIEMITAETGEAPVINQIELHPDFQQKAARAFHEKQRIVTQSWSPLGQGLLLDNPVIGSIARKHGRTPAQAIIRWHIDNGLVVIPKSVTPSRIAENLKVLDFKLDADDRAAIDALDSPDNRIGADPMTADF